MGVFERLTNLQNEKKFVPKPLSKKELGRPEPEKKIITPESVFIKNVESIIKKIEEIKAKMKNDTEMYLSNYSDLQRLERKFIELINKEEEEIKFMDLPELFLKRLEKTKSSLRTIKTFKH